MEEQFNGGVVKIPVLSVLKKGSLVKNIILNVPFGDGESSGTDVIVIGRHPECHIVLDHPSISRFHVDITVDIAAGKVSVTDRSSVHGTSVSGKKIEPQVPVDLVEGSTLQLGASTRVYELHWVSLSQAQEMDVHLGVLLEEKEDEYHQDDNVVVNDNSNEVLDVVIPPAPPVLDYVNFSSPHDFFSSTMEKDRKLLESQISAKNSDIRLQRSAWSGLTQLEEKASTSEHLSAVKISSDKEDPRPIGLEKSVKSSSLLSRRSKSIGVLEIPSGKTKKKEGNSNVLMERFDEADTLHKALSSSLQCTFQFSDKKVFTSGSEMMECLVIEKQEMRLADPQKLSLDTITLLNGEGRSHLDKEVCAGTKQEENDGYSLDKENSVVKSYNDACLPNNFDDNEGSSQMENCPPEAFKSIYSRKPSFDDCAMHDLEEVFASDKENCILVPSVHKKYIKNDLPGLASCGILDENLSSALHPYKESHTPDTSKYRSVARNNSEDQSLSMDGGESDASEEEILPPESSTKKLVKSTSGSSSVLAFNSDKEKLMPDLPEDLKSESSNARNCIVYAREDDPFYCDKDNMTPASSRIYASDKENMTPASSKAFASGKENRTPASSKHQRSSKVPSFTEIEKQIMKKRLERIPLQSLLNSPVTSFDNHSQKKVDEANIVHVNADMKDACSPGRSDRREQSISSLDQSVNQFVQKAIEEKKKWYMVVDTECFLDGESRRSLQLLEALKGTELIIPRMVIRELDYVKRHESWFRKTTKASSVLQWIERCMVNSSWWIHVQNSTEMLPVALTPPATPCSNEVKDQSDDASSNPANFKGSRTFEEIVSPTAEDHILNCALLFNKIKSDGQLIILSSSITLKIKAMAEGLLCETPKEFRESVVNPFSKRFMWADSSPRGSTWSCLDEMGLIDNYSYHQYLNANKVKAVDQARGLKLILLHNSCYGQPNQVE